MVDDPYSKVTRRMWTDDKFRGFSSAKPNAQTLWLYLLTAPRCTALPGLLAVGVLSLAEDLGWQVVATKKCLAEIEAVGMAKVDHVARLIWLPNAMAKHNMPANPSVVIGWSLPWKSLPECPLRREAAGSMRAALAGEDARRADEGRQVGLAVAFDVVTGAATMSESGLKVGRPRKVKGASDDEHLAEHPQEHRVPTGTGVGAEHGVPAGVKLQDQDQDQDQDQIQNTHSARARVEESVDGEVVTDTERAILGHLTALPIPLRHLATLDRARAFACGSMAGARLDDILDAITAAGLKLGAHRTATPERPETLDALADHVGTYIVHQKRFRAAEGRPRSAPTDPNAYRVQEFFAKSWERQTRERYVAPEQDLAPAAEVWDAAERAAERARTEGRNKGAPDAEAHVRHWIKRFFEDEDPSVRKANWPLRFLPKRIGSYGAPRAASSSSASGPGPAPAARREAEAKPAPPPPHVHAFLAGSTGAPAPRPEEPAA